MSAKISVTQHKSFRPIGKISRRDNLRTEFFFSDVKVIYVHCRKLNQKEKSSKNHKKENIL